MKNTIEEIKKLVLLYYDCEDEYYINLAMSELERGLSIAEVEEIMKQAEL